MFTLPVTLPRPADGSTGDECLKVANQPAPADASRLALLERCRAVISDDAVLLADLGSAYDAAGRDADAERVYRQVLELDPDYADVHLKLAARLLARGATADARAHANRASQLLPNEPSVTRLLAQLAQAAGEPTP